MAIMKSRMLDVLRLVRTGKLSEATKLIQRGSAAEREPQKDDHRNRSSVIDVEFEVVSPDDERVRERAPPSGEPGEHDRPRGSVEGAGEFLTGSFENSAGLRTYKLFVPARDDRAERLAPLIVMLHGCTQDADDFAIGTRMNEVAGSRGCYVLYPNQSTSANFKKCWQWFRPEDQRRAEGEPSILAGMTAKIIAEHPIDPSRVFVAGLSAGAAMAVVLGRTYPDLFAAVGSHSGLPFGVADSVPSAMAAMSGQRIVRKERPGLAATQTTVARPGIAIHGSADVTVVPANSDALVDQWAHAYSRRDGRPLEERRSNRAGAEVRQWIDAMGSTVVERWIAPGIGHAWSGGDSRGTYADRQGPDASKLLVDFFMNARV